MEQTTITTKKSPNGIAPKKRSSRTENDTADSTAPIELQNLLQALRAMRAGDFSVAGFPKNDASSTARRSRVRANPQDGPSLPISRN